MNFSMPFLRFAFFLVLMHWKNAAGIVTQSYQNVLLWTIRAGRLISTTAHLSTYRQPARKCTVRFQNLPAAPAAAGNRCIGHVLPLLRNGFLYRTPLAAKSTSTVLKLENR